MRTLGVSALALVLTGPVALGQQEISLRIVGLSQNGSGQYEVPEGGTVNWELWAEAPANGIAGISIDLACDLLGIDPGFALSPADSLCFGIPPDACLQDGSNGNFATGVNMGVVINDSGAGLSVIHTIGGSQDTADNLPAFLDLGGPLIPFPAGTVVPGVGEGTPILVASGSFSVAGIAAGQVFQLFTGGVPGNAAHTKMSVLDVESPGPPPADDCGFDPNDPDPMPDPGACGGDSQWTAILFDSSTLPALSQTHGPASPADLIIVEPTPIDIVLQRGLGSDNETFISPKREFVAFTDVSVETVGGENLTLVSAMGMATDGSTPTATLSSDGAGMHTLSLSSAVPVQHWVKMIVVATDDIGDLRTFTCWLGHLPCNQNQDLEVTISDVTTFSIQFRNPDPSLEMLDHDGSGVLSATDVTLFGASFRKLLGSTRAWNGLRLPDKPL